MFFAVTIVAALLVAIWVVAYRLGDAHRDAEWRSRIGDSPLAQPPTRDPARTSGGTETDHPEESVPAIPTPNDRPTAAINPTEEGGEANPAAVTPAPTRQGGFNYLVAARLPESDARDAAEFLSANGLPAGAFPSKLESTRAASNNRPVWEVVVLEGIAPGEFRQSDQKRASIEASVKRLGKRWNKEQRGPSDLSQPEWRKYQP
ncbi:MAG: hypothetical protein JNM07_03215 [Phycisphaerae bacterium]|nr:hypothetical protein [Phycisphaerae bacterium]